MIKRLLYFILFVTISSNVFGQNQVRVLAELDSTRILLGDHLKLNLRIVNADGVSNPSSDLSGLDKAEGVEVVSPGVWDTLNVRGRRCLQQEVLITSFDSGYYYIPQLPITYTQNGRQQTQSTPQLAFMVNTISTNPEAIAPIKPIIEEPISFVEDILPYLLGLLLLGLLAYGVYYYLQKRKKEEAPPPPEIIIPPHEVALSKFNALKDKQLWQKGEVKQYQSELTYIVREYIENRYNVQALESTSDEIIRDLKKDTDISEAHRTQLREMFTMADLVKFAKAEPPVDVNQKLMDYAEDFVIKTKKKIIEIEPTESENTEV